MKSFKAHSPVVQPKKSQLVPLKQKFSKTSVKEVPGWRLPSSLSPTSMKITPSKLSKVSNKRDFHSPLLFATDERLPVILSPASHKQLTQKRNLNKQTLEVPSMKNEKFLKKDGRFKEALLKKAKNFQSSVQDLPTFDKTCEDQNKSTPQKSAQVVNMNNFTNDSLSALSPSKNQSLSPSLSIKFTLSDRLLKDSLLDVKVKSDSGKVLNRRKSDTLARPRLRIESKKMTAEAFKNFSKSKSFESDSESEISETVSSESQENPGEEIQVLRKRLEPLGMRSDFSRRSFQGRIRPSVFLVPGKQIDELKNGKRSASFQNSSNSRSSYGLGTEDENEKSIKKLTPRKSATKEIASGNFLTLGGEVRRSVTERKSVKKDSRQATLFANDHITTNPGHLQSSLSPSQTLRKSSGHPSLNPSKSPRVSRNQTQKPLEPLQDFEQPSPSSKPSEKDPKSPHPSNPSLPLRRSPTVNLDQEKHSQVFTLKKFKSEKQIKNPRNPKSKKATLKEDLGTSEEKMMKMMIRITEAPDNDKNVYYQNNNYLVSMSPEGNTVEDDPHHLNILNSYAKHRGKKSDLPSRSRASSHEWSKDPVSTDLAKTKMNIKKNFRKTEANIQDMSKKYSLSPRQSKNESSSDSDDIYSIVSNESGQSKRSTTRKTTETRKAGKKPSNPPFRKSTLKNPMSLKFFKSFIISEVQKKLGTLDPVTNFLYNFSFSILKCIQTLSHITLLRNNKKVQMKRIAKPAGLEYLEKDSLLRDKLKVNKMKSRESRFFSTLVIPVTIKNKSHKKSESRKSLKKFRSVKNKEKNPRRSSELEKLEELEEISDFSSSQTSSSSEEEENLVTRTRKSILYELAKQELTLQIARQILEVKDDEDEPSPEKDLQKSESEETDEEIEDELAFLSKKLKTSTSNFAFGPDINFKQMQKNLMIFSFKELEEGCFEIDMENLMRESQKRKFIEKKILENELQSHERKDFQVAAEGNMTEEQMYRARIQKVRVIGKKLRKRREKMEGFTGIRVDQMEKKVIRETRDFFNIQSVGDNFEERVYFRLKGSNSQFFMKGLK
jgi:hypothetical protein